MIDLLPCPFCGGKASIYDAEAEYDEEFSGHVVMCEACGCETVAFSTQDKAVSTWNNRVTSDRENELEKLLAAFVNARHDEMSATGRYIRAIHRAEDLLKLNAD